LVTELKESVDTSAISASGGWGYTELAKLLQGCRKDVVGHARMMSAVGSANETNWWNR